MKRDAADILKDALALPPEARAAVASSLLESLDDQVDEGAEEAWKEEIARRLDDIDKGKVKLIPWATVRRRLMGR
ncbi:MAG: addiction module protein [Candidatus Polarisedimenticolia bacterium]|jgi:putative addiction module component (TIGR02574 family)